jgi:hypothetical protein
MKSPLAQTKDVLAGISISRTKESASIYSVVGVAQLVEPRIVIPVVVGSSPIVHPIPCLFSEQFLPYWFLS